jgi:predicted transglutaminase-like cysteine proteinase
VRQAIRILALVAAMTATATMIREDAGAALYAGPPQSVSEGASGAIQTPESAGNADISLQTDSYGGTKRQILTTRSQMAAYGSWPAPPSQGAWPAVTAYEPWLELKSYGSWPQSTFYGYPRQGEPHTSPGQPVSLEPPTQVEPSRHAPQPAPLGVLRRSGAPIVRIAFSTPVLAPFAHTRFCLAYPDECKVRKMVFRGGAIKLKAKRRAELIKVNAEVNRAIAPEPNTEGLAGEKWLIAPKSGECHDYAVTKRHDLIARGWPARALLLAEVVVASGEHHLVLVVRTHEGDLVADNLNSNIRSWSKTHYQWVRIQSPANPLYWATLARTTVYAQLR